MALKILRKITFNWHIKLLSILIAVIIWVYVDSTKEKEKFLSMPIEVRNIPTNYVISNNLTTFIKVVFKGKANNLALLNESNIKAFIDLENNTGPEIRKIIKIDKKSIPPGISIKEINPRIVQIRLEKIKKKMVNVITVVVGEPFDGYNFVDVLVEPEEVEIEGPESILNSIDSVYTDEINISSLKATTIKEVNIKLKEQRISLVDNKTVNVKIIIEEQYIVNKIRSIPISTLNLKENLKPELSIGNVNLSIKLPKKIEKSFNQDKIKVFIDFSAIDKPGFYDMPILFETTIDDVTLIKMEPEIIKVELKALK